MTPEPDICTRSNQHIQEKPKNSWPEKEQEGKETWLILFFFSMWKKFWKCIMYIRIWFMDTAFCSSWKVHSPRETSKEPYCFCQTVIPNLPTSVGVLTEFNVPLEFYWKPAGKIFSKSRSLVTLCLITDNLQMQDFKLYFIMCKLCLKTKFWVF